MTRYMDKFAATSNQRRPHYAALGALLYGCLALGACAPAGAAQSPGSTPVSTSPAAGVSGSSGGVSGANSSVSGDLTSSGRRLLSECRRDKVSPALSYRTVASDPVRYSGAEILVNAQLQGLMQIGDKVTYIAGAPDGSQISIDAHGDPTFASGNDVCILARAPEGWDPSQPLEMVDILSQYDAAPVIQALTPPPPIRRGTRFLYTRSAAPSRSYDADSNPARRQLLEQYASAVRWFNPRVDPEQAREIAGNIIWYSEVNSVDPRLVMAVIEVESDFDVNSKSNHGAMGLCQLMPGTARDLGVSDPWDPEQNIAGAVRLIRWHLQQNASSQDPLALALACYNAGENAVKRHHGVPPYKETVHYIQKIKQLYAAMCRADHP